MKKLIALLLAAIMIFAFAACGETKTPPATENPDATGEPVATGEPSGEKTVADLVAEAANSPVDTANIKAAYEDGSLKIGVILVGDENEGYTYAHIEGIEQAKEALGLSDDQVIYKYRVLEDETCYDTAVSLADQGCQMIFSNSFSHESYMIQAAAEYPDVVFLPATGTQAATCGLDNVVNYFPSVYESRYVSGVVAGMKLAELIENGKLTDANYAADGTVKIGYVGAYPYAEVVSGYTAFFLGVQSIVPNVSMEVVYTSSWFDIAGEAEAANSLISRGCCIISQHADSTGAPSATQAALDAGTTVYCVGYNVDMLSVAPTAALASAQNCWNVLYTDMIGAAIAGEPLAKNNTASYANDGVQISPLGESCAAGTAEKVDEIIAALKAGELHVFDISKFTMDGETVTSYTSCWGFEGIETIWDGYFHESELISAPLFDLRIDGITELS